MPTERQIAVLECIALFWARHGFAPALRELGYHLGIGSTNGVADHLKALERFGLVTSHPYMARTLRLTESGRRLLELKVAERARCSL